MSSYALNKNYKLQLPNSFVEIDREEMEYVDGVDDSKDDRLSYTTCQMAWR